MAEDLSWLGPVLNAGVLGPIVVVLGLYVRQLSAELRRVNDARVEDGKGTAQALLVMSEEHNKQTGELVKTMTENTAAMNNMRDAVRDSLRSPGE